MDMFVFASTTRRLSPPPQPSEKCKSCRRAPADTRFPGHCEPCYRLQVEMAFHSLPQWPTPVDTSCHAVQCLTCDIRFPGEFLFRDSRGIRKCVLCRRWELMHGIETVPGRPLHMTLRPAQGMRCLHCGRNGEVRTERMCARNYSWPRTSLFCYGCSYMEERYVAQGLINVSEPVETAFSIDVPCSIDVHW